ncbi:hypothetical protein A4X06_0g8777 [Tilletia controversa]|uniref:Uncharacterized protein n=1 Tax=Tilletia controversa TaxID=13291 RepID=A0A8X7SSS0_9BASI|nr:hypothetical protein CF335_g8327 [Tilletia laevis]KAE8238408.1 hypothetical protein A4X06_0g8777 [Tilletia controversa]
MGTLDSYFAAMRRSFPVNYSELRKLAQNRRWIPQEETAMAYSFDKVKLLRQVYGPQADERNIVSESLEGLDPSFRAIVQVPRTSMMVDSLREELGDQEPTWRDVHGIRIGDPPRPTSTTAWPRSDSQGYGATNTVVAVAVPDANKPPSREHESVGLAGPTALATKDTTGILLANYGNQSINIARRTPVADAVATHLGDVSTSSSHSFVLTNSSFAEDPSVSTSDPSLGLWVAVSNPTGIIPWSMRDLSTLSLHRMILSLI